MSELQLYVHVCVPGIHTPLWMMVYIYMYVYAHSINWWWMTHHYCSIAVSGLLLSWLVEMATWLVLELVIDTCGDFHARMQASWRLLPGFQEPIHALHHSSESVSTFKMWWTCHSNTLCYITVLSLLFVPFDSSLTLLLLISLVVLL